MRARASVVGRSPGLQDAHDAGGLEMSQFEGSGEPHQIVPVVDDEFDVDGAFGDLPEGSVVGGLVHSPETCPADIFQTRAEVVTQQPEEAEHGIRIGGAVGHDVCGIAFGVLVEQEREDDQAVAQGAGDDHGPETGILVGQHVVPGDATSVAEIFGVGPGMDGAFRGQEAQPVGRDRLPVSPMGGDGQFSVGGDDPGAGGGECVRADEILGEPGQAVAPQRRMIFAHEGFGADIAGLGDEDGAEAGLKMRHVGGLVIKMGEGGRESCAVHHLEKNVRDSAFREAAMHRAAQLDQTGRFRQAIQPPHRNPAFAFVDLEPQIGVLIGARGDAAKRCVQKIGQTAHLTPAVEGVAQCPAHDSFGVVPSLPFQHADAGIRIADARGGEDVAPLDSLDPRLNGGQNIGFGIGHPAILAEDGTLPGAREHSGRGISQGRTGPVGMITQPIRGGGHRLPTRCALEIDACDDLTEQFLRPPPSVCQFRDRFGRDGVNTRVDCCHGLLNCVFRDARQQSVFPQMRRQIVIGDDQCGQMAQNPDRRIHLSLVGDPPLVAGGFRVPEQVGDQRFSELCGFVLGGGFQCVEECGHRRGAARLLQGGESGRFGCPGDACQPLQLRRRDPCGRRGTQAKGAHRIQSIQMFGQLGRLSFQRRGPQDLQPAQASLFCCEQVRNLGALRRRQAVDETRPQTRLDPLPDSPHKALECRDTGQEHVVINQPIRGRQHQGPRAFMARPARRIEPAGQTKTDLRGLAEMHEAVMFSDGTHMTRVRPGAPVPLQINRIFEFQLRPEDGQNFGRNGGIGIRKRSQETHAAQKCGISQTIVCPPESTQGLQSLGIQHKAPHTIFRPGRAIETAETLALGIGQVTCWHGVRNSSVVQRFREGRKTRADPVAQLVCERESFCKKFRTGQGTPWRTAA